MIGVGAMIGAGIFVLTGIAAGESGPASILAFGLNGAATLLTAFAYAELASAIPEAGGGYAFVRRAFPGVVGFIAGWMLWFAYTVACSLYALSFAGYFWEFFLKYTPELADLVFALVGEHGAALVVTFVIGALFVRLNARGAGVTGMAENVLTVSKLIILGIFIAYGLRALGRAPSGQIAEAFKPQVLERPVPARVRAESTVVVPLHNPDHVGILLDYARPIAESRNKPLVVYSVVEVPCSRPRSGCRSRRATWCHPMRRKRYVARPL